MTLRVIAHPESPHRLEWRDVIEDDLDDRVVLEITLLHDLGLKFRTEREALAYAKRGITAQNVDFIHIHNDEWIIDLDQLRNKIINKTDIPIWLNGKRRSYPIVSNSYVWEHSDTFGRFAATDREHATHASICLSWYFQEVDPIALIRSALMTPQRPVQPIKPALPPGLDESLAKFRKDYADTVKTAFVVMRFGTTEAHSKIMEVIQNAVTPFGVTALRADTKEYHADLFQNVLTYIYGCTFGIAIYERIETEDFNPNVALEVGYMLALGKRICFLKDRSLRVLHSDLVGKLYRNFDTYQPEKTIPASLQAWLSDYATELGIAKQTA